MPIVNNHQSISQASIFTVTEAISFHIAKTLGLEHTGWRLLAILRRKEWPANDADEDADFHLL